jgi:hypothetical protein
MKSTHNVLVKALIEWHKTKDFRHNIPKCHSAVPLKGINKYKN